MRMNNIIPCIVMVIFFFGGMFLIFDGFASYQSTSMFLSTAAESQGQVIQLIEVAATDSERARTVVYEPLIRFPDQAETDVEFQWFGSNPAAFNVGDSVSVVYQPGEPQNARVNTFSDLWLRSIISAAFGVAFFWLSLLLGFLLLFKKPS